MGRYIFSIPPTVTAPQPSIATGVGTRPKPRRGARQPKAKLQWEGADGRAIGSPIELQLPRAVPLEYPHTDGRMGWTDQPVSPAFSGEPPDEAVALRYSAPGTPTVRIPRAALSPQPAALSAPQTQTFGPADAALLVPVFSERFVDKDSFMGKVREFYEWTIAQPPFDREPTKSRIALVGHFWSSDADVGMFNTPDSASQGGQLFYGNRELAKNLLAPWTTGARVSLILINSTMRGGAGGQRGVGGQPGYSAWTSIAPAPGEHWENVCLHEVGHGLDLADEYLQDPAPTEPPAILEPNVSRSPVPSQTPWGDLPGVLPDAPAPSFSIATQGGASADAIGTFQGARYKTNLYRASRDCLMRDTRLTFCTVCQKHIETILTTPLIV